MPEEIDDGLDELLNGQPEPTEETPPEPGAVEQPPVEDDLDYEAPPLPQLDQDDLEDNYAPRVLKQFAYVQGYVKGVIADIKKEVGELPNGFAEQYEALLLNVPPSQLTPEGKDLYITQAIGMLARQKARMPKTKPVEERTPPASPKTKEPNKDAVKLARALGLADNAFDEDDI